MTLQGTNSYLVQPAGKSTAPCILVDTTQDTTAESYVKIVIDHLRKLGAPLEHIVLTHRHHDHTGAVVPLLRALKDAGSPPPKVWKMRNPDEARLLASTVEHESRSSDKRLEETLTEVEGSFQRGPDSAVHDLKDGQEVSVKDGDATATVRVLYTPGHTDDSIALVVESTGQDEVAVMTADTVLGQGTTIFTDFGACERDLDSN